MTYGIKKSNYQDLRPNVIKPNPTEHLCHFRMAKSLHTKFQQNILAYTCRNVLLDQLRRKYQRLLAGVMTSTTARSRKKRRVQET